MLISNSPFSFLCGFTWNYNQIVLIKPTINALNSQDTTHEDTTELIDENDVDRTVFQSSIDELIYLKKQLIKEVVESIYYTVTARSVKYRSEVIFCFFPFFRMLIIVFIFDC